MSSHKIRSFIAATALTLGVSWLFAAPTSADSCTGGKPGLVSPDMILSACDANSRLSLDDGGAGANPITNEASRLAMDAGAMARQAGLDGLATVSPVLGTGGLGGVAAAWNMPSLLTASPELFPGRSGPLGLEDLATASEVPQLPALPLPGTPPGSKLPKEVSFGNGPFNNSLGGSGVSKPVDAGEPVEQISNELLGALLPEVEEVVADPGIELPQAGPDDVTGLLQGFTLR